MLTCSACGNWMNPSEIRMCKCKVICKSCLASLPKCEDCKFKFKRNIRAIRLHQRIAGLIDRPCKNMCDGCTYIVTPSDTHEEMCEYAPVECHRCQEYISKARMQEHFEEVHFLRSKNVDVKLADFFLEDSGSRKLKCVANQDVTLYISILNVESVGEFNQFTVLYPVTESNVCVKLDFNKDGYLYSRTNSKPSNNVHNPMSFIDIDKKIFTHWVNNESKLDIEVSVRKKRQNKMVRKETPKKIAKTVKEDNRGMDKQTIRSLKAAHKQRLRNEYLKSRKVDIKKEC